MVKFTVWNDGKNILRKKCENTKFTRELNTYGFDQNGNAEELLFPIRLNKSSGGNQETSLATYLVKFMEFEKTYVKIKYDAGKERFRRFYISALSEVYILKFPINSPYKCPNKFIKTIDNSTN